MKEATGSGNMMVIPLLAKYFLFLLLSYEIYHTNCTLNNEVLNLSPLDKITICMRSCSYDVQPTRQGIKHLTDYQITYTLS